MSILTYSWVYGSSNSTWPPLDALSAANRPQGIEIATLTTFDIPALAVLTLEAYDDDVTPEALLETSEELRLTFEGAFWGDHRRLVHWRVGRGNARRSYPRRARIPLG